MSDENWECRMKNIATHQARDTPDIGASAPVRTADNGFGRAILARLNVLRIMLLRRRGVSEVGNLDRYLRDHARPRPREGEGGSVKGRKRKIDTGRAPGRGWAGCSRGKRRGR
jgi:hypothetical protein